MDFPSTVPLTISPEAEAHVEALGMRVELERMLEHAAQTLPDLQQIRVVLDPPYDTGDEDAVVIEAYRDPAHFEVGDPARARWRDWFINTFPPDVRRHFTLLTIAGTAHNQEAPKPARQALA